MKIALYSKGKAPGEAIRAAATQRGPTAIPMSEGELLKVVKGWVNPSDEEIRRAFTDFARLTRSYAAGMITQYNADFVGTYGTANTEILPGKYTVRAKSRTLVKDTPQGATIQRTFADNVAGPTPFKLDMRYGQYQDVQVTEPNSEEGDGPAGTVTRRKWISDEETNTAIEEFWEWQKRPENFSASGTWGFNEFCRMVVCEQVVAGGLLNRLYRDCPFTETRFAVRGLEEDRLQEMYFGTAPNGNPIRGSIEFDKIYGRPVAYWILVRHPGEFLAIGAYEETKGQNFRERVPAEEMIHLMNLRDRAEQEFGQTELAAAMQPIWRSNQFDTALTLCAIASHIRAFVLEKKLPTGIELPQELRQEFVNIFANYGYGVGPAQGNDPNNPVAAQQGVGMPTQTLRPGQERELPFGVEAKVLDPKFPTEESHMFRLDARRDTAIATGISYQHASGDFQNLGFIAGLMCQIPFQLHCKIRQQHLKDNWLYRLFKTALKSAILSGWFDRRGYDFISIQNLEKYVAAARFKGMRWPFVNPLVQMQTLILAFEAGFMSPQQVQDEMPDGVSIEDLYTMYAEAKAEAEKHGLDFSSADVTRPGLPKGVPGETQATPQTQTEKPAASKTKTSNPVREELAPRRRSHISIEALLAMSTNGQH